MWKNDVLIQSVDDEDTQRSRYPVVGDAKGRGCERCFTGRLPFLKVKISMNPETFGNITLYNADCMDVMREMPDKAFDLAIVDPPRVPLALRCKRNAPISSIISSLTEQTKRASRSTTPTAGGKSSRSSRNTPPMSSVRCSTGRDNRL